MPALRDLRRRVKSVKSTQKICKAMKAVATAKMSRAQAAVTAARPYARQMQEVLGRVSSVAGNVKHPLLAVREPKKACYVVVTSDRGLCGGFNSQILRKALNEIGDRSDVSVVPVGRKARQFFRFRGWDADTDFVGLSENVKLEEARQIAQYVIKNYSEEQYDVVYLLYNKFVNVLVQEPTKIQLLPVEPPEAGEGEGKEGKKTAGMKTQYIFEPSAEDVLSDLLPRYVEMLVFYALLESKASEHSARMTAMDSASKNAGEMIDKLTLQINRLRQEGITKELLDIVGGAAALE
ncbi:MAG: F0F1 ATP synthase subunit gamma [Peptococcaceae bacterium]|nr:F0F1 ATP synthase subunit gamma [Peptococcaceae bacterium]